MLLRLPQRFDNLFNLRSPMLRNPMCIVNVFSIHFTLRYVTVLYANWWTALHKLSFVAGKITSHFLRKQTEIGASLSTDPRLKTSKVFFKQCFVRSGDVEQTLENVNWSVPRMRVYISVNCFFTACFIYNDKVAPYVTFFCISAVVAVYSDVILDTFNNNRPKLKISSRWVGEYFQFRTF